jgi:uncharacterized membrane protein YbhN (UPF0104 family)
VIQPSGPGRWRQIAYVGLGLIVGGLGLFLALDEVDGEAVLTALRGVRAGWLLLAVLGVVLVALLKAARWYWLFTPNHQAVDWRALLTILLLAQVSNVAVPIRGVGEMLRVGLTVRRFPVSVLRVGGTIVVEKLVDLLALGGIALVSAPVLGQLLGPLALTVTWWLVAVGVLVLLLASILWLAPWRACGERGRSGWLGRWHFATRHLDQLSSGFAALRSRAAVWELTGWTVAVWALSLGSLVCTLQATAVSVPVWGGVLLLLLLHLGFLLPTPPGLIGLVQYVCVRVLTFFDVPRSQAFGTGIVLHLVLVVPLVLCAVLAWFFMGRELL